MSLKYRAAAALLCALLLTGCGNSIEGRSKLSPIGTSTIEDSSAPEEPVSAASITRTCNVSLIKDETRTLDFTTVSNENATISVTSSDEDVVSVTGLEITAKKCGDAVLTAVVSDGKTEFTTTINVTVSISRFDESIDYTAGGFASDKELPGFVHYGKLKVGSTETMTVEGADTVTYTSSDETVATVSETGEITAVAPGEAVITALAGSGKASAENKEVITVYKSNPSTKIPQSQLDAYFGGSVFVGCSLGVGHQLYLESMGEDYLGGPLYLALSSYGIYNDGGLNGSDYQLSYNGVTAPVSELLAQTDAHAVFINLGTNDMYSDAEQVGADYIEYIKGIRAQNPTMVIYIEALTPVSIGSETEFLNNENVDALNAILKDYCDTNPDIYYIDISTIMKNDQGGLKDEYSSDGYVHLTNEANEAWTKKVVNFVKNQLVYEERAEDAVLTYEEARTETALEAARNAIDKVGEGAVKTALLKRIES